MLSNSNMHLLAPKRHAAALGRLLAGGRRPQGSAQLHGDLCLTPQKQLMLRGPVSGNESNAIAAVPFSCCVVAMPTLSMLDGTAQRHTEVCFYVLLCASMCCCHAGDYPVFTQFAVYNSKGALSVKPKRAKWGYLDGGAPKLEK